MGHNDSKSTETTAKPNKSTDFRSNLKNVFRNAKLELI